ncbi:MAG: ATP-binding protein [Mediterraneibacter gnavus]
MEELRIFSPGADTYFPLHINPFQFPVGLTLAEHIANLNAVFAGAFELPPPSPHFIDTCIEKVYLDKGWNVNERNTLDENGNYRHKFPTLQELYASLEIAVKNSHYQGETLGNLQSVLEVRVGSLLKREIGNVYNVRESILKPEQWLDVPAIIELEALGEGPANFMSLLLSTLIRETLKVRKTSDNKGNFNKTSKDLNHVIFYEEAHNLIGPDTDSPMGDSVDPKISATKYVVKMLAEVRALGEGIVIADQLPTVMAPEVLKNTGLKIAHRITAQDDRSLLGSTMSASPDQLEEQGTFGTGWALIFYEDLLKPYKMRVHEWDIHNKDKNKYESPTNKQLFSYLKENQTYRSTLLTSAKIMKEKMDVEYDQLRRRGEKLKENIDKEYLIIRALNRGIENQETASMEMQVSENVERNKIELQKQKQAVVERMLRFLQKYSRELHQLCWDYINQYYATITLANNYDFASEKLYAASVSGFFTIFETMRSLVDVPELTETLVSELKNVVSDTERFVSLDKTKKCVLKGSDIYPDLQYASGYYWVNDTYLKKKNLVAKAKRILQLDSDREKYINSYCIDWTNEFIEVYQKADAYAEATESLILIKESEAKVLYVDEPETYEHMMKQINDYKNKKYALYKMLHSMVVGPIKEAFRFLNGADRIAFLKASKKVRELHLEIVNYLDSHADAKLSGCERYKKLREEATVIINMDLLARIELARSNRLLQTEQLISSNSTEEKKKIIRLIRDTHNAYFEAYSRYNVERFDYQIILVNFYMQYLDSMMDFGDIAVQEMISDDPSRYEVKKCSEIIQKLISNNTVPETQKISWNRIQNRWIKFFKEA